MDDGLGGLAFWSRRYGGRPLNRDIGSGKAMYAFLSTGALWDAKWMKAVSMNPY